MKSLLYWQMPDEPPDDEMTVLLRIDDDEDPLVIGFHDAGEWRDAASAARIPARDVLGWMAMDLMSGGAGGLFGQWAALKRAWMLWHLADQRLRFLYDQPPPHRMPPRHRQPTPERSSRRRPCSWVPVPDSGR